MLTLTRRGFLGAATLAPALAASGEVPRIDFHAHPEPFATIDEMIEAAKQRGVKLGILEHAGKKEHTYQGLLSSDEDLKRHIARLDGKPVFKGIQAEWTDWFECFSKDTVAQLDYVLSDALTMPDKLGTPERTWRPGYAINNKQEWMERYVNFNVRVMKHEPIDILANPTFLPAAIMPEYDALWTPDRMKRLTGAAAEYNVAFEITTLFRIPRLPFLKIAKQAGVRFSFGSNYRGKQVGDIEYGLEMAKELGLKGKDMFAPAPYGRKPIQVRKF